jgi:malate dehydrogenase
MPVEKRVDPEDGSAYTFEELAEYYRGKYKKAAINDYWESCKPVKQAKGKGKGDAKATAKTKAKAKAEPKVKAKAKAAAPKAKVKAKAKAKKTTPAKSFKVCVCGGAGGIGQPLSMLMSMDPNVGELTIFDLSVAMVPPAGVAADLSHLEKKAEVKGYVMEVGGKPIEHLQECLTGCDLVMIPAGMPRKPGQTRDDLFKINADIAKGLVEACAKFCPEAILALIVNPVNSIVPAMAELYKKKGLDPLKIVGVTTLDCVRANKFVSQLVGKSPNFINVPVVGGHAGVTILPLFSQVPAMKGVDADKITDLDKRVQDAGTEVVNAKGGKGSATLSMAYAGSRLGRSVLAGLSGRRRVECAYVASTVEEGFAYFTSKVVFGQKGVEKVLPVGTLNDYEKGRMEECKAALKAEIETGVNYAKSNSLAD